MSPQSRLALIFLGVLSMRGCALPVCFAEDGPVTFLGAHEKYVAELEKVLAKNGSPEDYIKAAKQYVSDLDKVKSDQTAPAILTSEPAPKPSKADLMTGELKAPWEADSARDDQWYADVEEALRYLHRRQEHTIDRVTKLEQAMIQVRKPSGQVVERSVPVRNGYGYFDLAPGETLTGYQDAATGQWISTAQPQVVHTINSVPVYGHSTPSTEIRMVNDPNRGVMRGACRIVNGRKVCSTR